MTFGLPDISVANRFSERNGHRLLTYREVGIPFWEIPLRCLFLRKKMLPAVDEFVLRCVDAGLGNALDVAGILAIPPRAVEAVMGSLISTGDLLPLADANVVTYKLTAKGRTSLIELGSIVPEERVVKLSYDGLLNSFSIVEQSSRMRPKDLKAESSMELRAFPVSPPEFGPDHTSKVSTAVSQLVETNGFELISVLKVDGRRERFFVNAVALVFESIDDVSDKSVQFLVDGRLREDYSVAFAKANGPKLLGILDGVSADGDPADAVLDADVRALRRDDVEVSSLRRMTSTLSKSLSEVVLDESVHSPDPDSLDRASVIADRLEVAERALDEMPVRVVEVHEHPTLLLEAITTASRRLLIVSPWMTSAVVNAEFGAEIQAALERGVDIRIGFGIDDGRQSRETETRAERLLRKLAVASPGLIITRLGDTHAKILIVDDRFLVVSSFNWLSFKGDPNRPFRDERGTLVTIKGEIDRVYSEYAARVEAGATD